MKKNLAILISSMLMSLFSIAQNSHWIMAPKYYKFVNNNLPIESSLPTLPTSVDSAYHGEAARYSQNIQMDASGNNILFFIVDNKVYDRKGKRIVGTESGFTTYNLVSYQRYQDVHTYNEQIYMTGSASEVIIIPDKNDCNLFHIISSGTVEY